MMNREKEIKDICKLMCATCAQFDGCAINCKAHRDAAEALYSVGYRKIDENCIVITKDELKLYKMQAVKEFAEKLKAKACRGCIDELIGKLLKEYEK